MQLGHILHLTADRAYEDFRQLQNECTSASDALRRQKITNYCEIQRHRFLQLLALYRFCENEADILVKAIKSLGEPATAQLNRIRSTVAKINVDVNDFEAMLAPQYDVSSAVDSLINSRFTGFPRFVDELFQSTGDDGNKDVTNDTSNKRIRLMESRLASKFLVDEIDFALGSTETRVSLTPEGELWMDCEKQLGFSVKLAVEKVPKSSDMSSKLNGETMRFYPTALRVVVKSEKRDGSSRYVPTKHAPLLASNIEHILSSFEQSSKDKTSATSVLKIVRNFLRHFCGDLVLAILADEAKSRNLEHKLILSGNISSKDERSLEVKTPVFGVWLRISFDILSQNTGRLCNFFMSVVEKDVSPSDGHPLPQANRRFIPIDESSKPLEGSTLSSLSLIKLLRETSKLATKWRLEELRKTVLQKDSRHHSTQIRVVLCEDMSDIYAFELQMDLFMNASSQLIVRVSPLDGSLYLSTTSKAPRWGFYSVREALDLAAKIISSQQEKNHMVASVLCDVWNEAEAWDALASHPIIGLDISRSSSLPPTPELALNAAQQGPTNSAAGNRPAAYWDFGLFEGLRYVFALRYSAPPSAFHAGFLSDRSKIVECLKAEIISLRVSRPALSSVAIQNESTIVKVQQMDLNNDNLTKEAISQVIHTMRFEFMADQFTTICGMFSEPSSLQSGASLWRATDEDTRRMEPFELILLEPGESELADEADRFSCCIRCRVGRGGPNPASSPGTGQSNQGAGAQGERIWCSRRENIVDKFKGAIRRNSLLERLSECTVPGLTIALNLHGKKFCKISQESDQPVSKPVEIFVGFTAEEALSIRSPPGRPNPLSKLVGEFWEQNNSTEMLELGLRLMLDAHKLTRAGEAFASRFGEERQLPMVLRVRPTSLFNLHFVFEHPTEAYNEAMLTRRVVDFVLDGQGHARRWNRQSWRGAMLSDAEAIDVDAVCALFDAELHAA